MHLICAAFPRISLRKPVLASEGNQRDVKRVSLRINSEHDRKAVPTTAMSDKPAFKWWCKPHTGMRLGRDLGQKVVDLIQSSPSCGEVPLRRLYYMVDQCREITFDQRVSDQAHQLGSPPPNLAICARCIRASAVKLFAGLMGSQASSGKLRRRCTSTSNNVCSRSRAARARAISPETAALMLGYSPLSTRSRAKAKAVSVKLTLCLWTPIFVSPPVVCWSTIDVLGLSFNVEAGSQPSEVFYEAVLVSEERHLINVSQRGIV